MLRLFPCLVRNYLTSRIFSYQEEVLGTAPRIAIEAAAKFGWERYVGLKGDVIGMDGFGASGPAEELYGYFGITLEEVVDSVKNCLK